MVSLKSSPWPKYTQLRTIFQKKNCVRQSNFFSSLNTFFIGLFLANAWKKIGGHHACLRQKEIFCYWAHVHTLMTWESCALGMCSAILRDYIMTGKLCQHVLVHNWIFNLNFFDVIVDGAKTAITSTEWRVKNLIMLLEFWQNFQHFKMVLNPAYRIFLNLPKLAPYHAYQILWIQKKSTALFFNYKALKL